MSSIDERIAVAREQLRVANQEKAASKKQVLASVTVGDLTITPIQATVSWTLPKFQDEAKKVRALEPYQGPDAKMKGKMVPAIIRKRSGQPVFKNQNRKYLVVQSTSKAWSRVFFKTSQSAAIHDSTSHPTNLDDAAFRAALGKYLEDKAPKAANWMSNVPHSDSFDNSYGKLKQEPFATLIKEAFPPKVKVQPRETKPAVKAPIALTGADVPF
jgi:hypothetical protein